MSQSKCLRPYPPLRMIKAFKILQSTSMESVKHHLLLTFGCLSLEKLRNSRATQIALILCLACHLLGLKLKSMSVL